MTEIFRKFCDIWLSEAFVQDAVPSLVRFAAGMAIAVILGLTIGVPLGLNDTAYRAVRPIIDFLRSLPKPAILPIAIVVLGIGWEMKVFIIAFGTIWPILLNTIDGVRGVDTGYLDTAQAYRISRVDRLRRIILPAASPQIYAGIRLAIGIGLILMIVSEMVASTNGIGYFILLAQQDFSLTDMWTGIILLGIIGYLINVIYMVFERRALIWHRGWRQTQTGA
ncbi:ABC transporter permease [Leekyejoonella antrihumi]|uniref:ABC transporter permease n=1 Tax=Leekyejoonella antrihumi TaxID=1660198 RepID=UPI001C95BFA5|nr:ABC transporter permease [Leekyejoonella antrihumi]